MSLTISNSSQAKVLIPGTCQHCLHLYTAPSDKSTLTLATHSQGEEIHRRRQTCNSIDCPIGLNVSAQTCQHSQSPRLYGNSRSTGNSPSSQFHSSSYSCEPDSHLNPELLRIPPPPSDLLALHETWEHIRACCSVERTVSNRSLIQFSSSYTDKHRLLGTSLVTRLPARLRSRKQSTHGTWSYIPAIFESRTQSHVIFQISSKVTARLLKNASRNSALENSWRMMASGYARRAPKQSPKSTTQ